MLAMLRKDLYVMRKYTAVFIISWMVVAGVSARILNVDGSFLYHNMPVFAFAIVLNAVDADERCRWDRFAAMTPLWPWQIVLAKYVFVYGILLLTTGLSVLVGWAVAGDEGRESMWAAAAAVFAAATALPLRYRFGRQMGTVIMLLFWGFVAAVVIGGGPMGYTGVILSRLASIHAPALAAGTAVVLTALNVWSVRLSIRFYTRRQRGWYG